MWSEAKPSPDGLWQLFLQAVEPTLSAHVIANWLKPVRCISIDGDVVTLEVRDEFCRNWLSDHYLNFVRDHLEGILRRPLNVHLAVASVAHAAAGPLTAEGAANGDAQQPNARLAGRERKRRAGAQAQGPAPAAAAVAGDATGVLPAVAAMQAGQASDDAASVGATGAARGAQAGVPWPAPEPPAGEPVQAAVVIEQAPVRQRRRATRRPKTEGVGASNGARSKAGAHPFLAGPARILNDRYTFDRFVEGPSNELAYAASRAVAEKPGVSYNPLFLVGGVGLGKTHLLSAIGHAIAAKDVTARVRYTSSEEFASEVVAAVRGGRLEQMRVAYRDHVDVLLMDDIQLMAGKERTQHEFFQLFNTLYDSHRQIVVTSDKLPHEIPDIQERLSSRFQWGLIADVQPPEVETRIAILRKKAEAEKLVLPNDVAFFLARAIRSNVRELEGALVRITAQSSLSQLPLTIQNVRACLSDILQHRISDLSIESIQRAVAVFYAVRMGDIKGINRKKDVVRARQVAMYLCRKHLASSFPEIGQRFGHKDHTTALSACQRIASGRTTDAALRGQLVELEHRLEQAVPG